MIERFVGKSKDFIVPPPQKLLKEALSIDPRVNYFSSDSYDISRPHYAVEVPIREWLSGELSHFTRDSSLGTTFYCAIVLALSEELRRNHPRPFDIIIRGSAVSIGDTINVSNTLIPGNKIKGIREVVETGSENWREASTLLYLAAPKVSPGMHDSFAGSYAYLHTRDVEESTPYDYKHLIHPLVLVKDDLFGKLTDFYILDKLNLR